MKIALVDNLPDGGAKRVVFEQLKYLSKKHQVEYYSHKQKSIFPFEKYAKQVFRFQLESPEYQGLLRPLKELWLLTDMRQSYKQMAETINRSEAEVVIVHPCKHTQAPGVLRFLRKPGVYYLEETLRIVYEPDLHQLEVRGVKRIYEQFRRLLIKKVDKFNLSKADKLLTNSKFTAEQIKASYQRQAEVIYLGVDGQVFKPKPKIKKKHFLFIGEKKDINDYPLLAEALARLGSEFKVKYVEFRNKGFKLSDRALIKLYQKSWAVLCLSKNETFGLTAIEAMACGVGVIAVNEGSHRETVIDGKTGLLVKREVDELVKAMKLLKKDEKLRDKLGKQGREHVKKNFSWQKHGVRLEKSLQSIRG